MNPDARLVTGVVCGVRVEEIADPLMRKIRCLDKRVDELARGKQMASILQRSPRGAPPSPRTPRPAGPRGARRGR
jgi:hypothetical protein